MSDPLPTSELNKQVQNQARAEHEKSPSMSLPDQEPSQKSSVERAFFVNQPPSETRAAEDPVVQNTPVSRGKDEDQKPLQKSEEKNPDKIVEGNNSDKTHGGGGKDSNKTRENKALERAISSMRSGSPAGIDPNIFIPGMDGVPLDAEAVQPGDELTGTVVGLTDDEVFLEFSAKLQGIVARTQFGKKEQIDVGRRVDVVADHFDESSGMLLVNRKGAVQRATWTNLSKGMLVEGKVTGMNKGGLEVNINGLRAFMPASQVSLAPMKDISELLSQTVQCSVMEFDRRKKNILVSRRQALAVEAAQQREKLKSELEVGQIRRGVVGNITEFGAFVDLGGIDGLIHKRDLSWAPIEKVTDVLQAGQVVEVKILRMEKDGRRISLGYRQIQPDPWTGVEERYTVGSMVKARVVRLANFGAFAELEPGIEGLIPISEVGWDRVHRISDVVSEGVVVDVAILRVEPKRRRIALSIKQATPDPWAEVLESYPEKSLVQGTITRLAAFGAFVQLAPGVEGLIHISELSRKHVKTCSEVVQEGQEVEARVLGVDKENRRIALSIKAVDEPEASETEQHSDKKAQGQDSKKAKKRKRPLRGGLASHWDWM